MRQSFVTASVLLVMVAVAYGQSQIASSAAAPLFYDVSQETTLTGTVAVLSKVSLPGTLPGAHLTLTTPNSSIDVSLGNFAFSGKGALSLAEGLQIEVTGVFKRLRGSQVLLARLVKVGDSVYAIRNIHGLPVTPQPHERANQHIQNEETR